MSDSEQYTLRWRGRQSGPFSLAEVNRKLDEHEIGMGHEICHDDKWMTLEEFFGSLNQAAPAAAPSRTEATPPPAPAPRTAVQPPTLSSSGVRLPGLAPATQVKAPATQQPVEVKPEPAGLAALEATPPPATKAQAGPRRRLVYALLAIGGGFAGLHNYYARHWLTGLLQFLLAIATYLLGFGIIASWLWAVVEAVAVRKDGDGLEMT